MLHIKSNEIMSRKSFKQNYALHLVTPCDKPRARHLNSAASDYFASQSKRTEKKVNRKAEKKPIHLCIVLGQEQKGDIFILNRHVIK